MGIRKQAEEINSWLNWNYIGLAAGILSVIVTFYNMNKYLEEIKKVE